MRQLKNPKQTNDAQVHRDPKGYEYTFLKHIGYCFSDDKSMDYAVEYFKSIGFVESGKESKSTKKVEKVAVKKE